MHIFLDSVLLHFVSGAGVWVSDFENLCANLSIYS